MSRELRGPRAEDEGRSAEARNAYGFPTGVTREEPGVYRVRRAADADADADAWYADLPEGERAALRLLQERVARAVRGLVGAAEVRWLAEETLWQIRAQLRAAGRVVLPELGTLELVELEDGSACLLATASPGLRCAPSLPAPRLRQAGGLPQDPSGEVGA